jgi:hypothetical protein
MEDKLSSVGFLKNIYLDIQDDRRTTDLDILEDGRRTARAWQILVLGHARRAGAGARVGGRALGVSAWWISVA